MATLEQVRELNYDHHRRMSLLHAQKVRMGLQNDSSAMDDASYRHILSVVPKDRNRVLELGSASGGQWPLLQEWTKQPICGIDLYRPLVSLAQKAGLHIVEGYVEDMNMYPDDSFDLVCSRHVMEHLGDVDRGIREIRRILSSGGFSAHVTPDLPVDPEPAHLNKFVASEWADIWASYGFQILMATKLDFHGGETHIVAIKL